MRVKKYNRLRVIVEFTTDADRMLTEKDARELVRDEMVNSSSATRFGRMRVIEYWRSPEKKEQEQMKLSEGLGAACAVLIREICSTQERLNKLEHNTSEHVLAGMGDRI